MVVNAGRGALEGKDPFLILFCKLCQAAVHGSLQLLLHFQVNRRINAVSCCVQAVLAFTVTLAVIRLVCFLFLCRGKFCLELEPLLLHQATDCAVISISLHIVILLLLGAAKGNCLRLGLITGRLADFPILAHLVEDPVAAL